MVENADFRGAGVIPRSRPNKRRRRDRPGEPTPEYLMPTRLLPDGYSLEDEDVLTEREVLKMLGVRT